MWLLLSTLRSTGHQDTLCQSLPMLRRERPVPTTVMDTVMPLFMGLVGGSGQTIGAIGGAIIADGQEDMVVTDPTMGIVPPVAIP
jgi:hypothetical protein